MRTYCQHPCPYKKRRLTRSPINFWTKLLTKANSEALLQYGRNATTRALAQAIIADQRKKIAALQNWLTRNR